MYGPAYPGGIHNGEDLFDYCQNLAETRYPSTSGQGKPPGGARIFYFTRLALLRADPSAVVEPDTTPLPPERIQRFLALAPRVAQRLALDFKRAVRLRDLKQFDVEARRFLRRHVLLSPPHLHWAPEHHVGIYEPLRQRWQDLWKAYWRQAQPDHLRHLQLRLRLHPHHLLIMPVAHPALPREEALQALRQRLAEDRAGKSWTVPPPELYLYDEPLDEWLLRPLLSGKLFLDLCQTLAELAHAVPALVRSRAEALGVKDEAQQADALKQEIRRRIPLQPQGTASGAALYYYAVSAARAAGLPAEATRDDDVILPDVELVPLQRFQELLKLATTAAEHLLWDDTLAARALPTGSPEQRALLRQALLSPRLRRQYADLARKERWRHAQGQTGPLPAWHDWEALLATNLDELALRLAASTAPAAITAANLPDLLRMSQAAPGTRYLYQTTVGEWLRGALPPNLPDGNALLAFCQALAEALGAWPTDTRGAPASAEQAARAIFWYTKQALEARIGREPEQPAPTPTANAPNSPETPPRREDGGLVIWLDAQPLPGDALELASLIAPLVAQVIYQSSWEAARQGKALFVARLKAGDLSSWNEIEHRLMQRAQDLNLPNREEAVLEACRLLAEHLERLALPDALSAKYLAGDKVSLATLDVFIKPWYIINRGCYQFLGGFSSYARSFIRADFTTERSLNTLKQEPEGDEPEESVSTFDLDLEDQAALQVLAFLLQRALTPPLQGRAAQEALLLMRWAFTLNNGRRLIERFARQGEPAAVEITRLWQAQTLPTEGVEPAITPGTETQRMKHEVALARFLASPTVQRAPALRRAVGDLFEVPMRHAPTDQPTRLRLGTLERLGAWATRQSQRGEVLKVLQALERVPKAQRAALCARLLAQQPIALLLTLLEQHGWVRPSWLRGPRESSPQLFLHARRHWLRALIGSATIWRARALAVEFLGIQFWGHPWQARPDMETIAAFYATLLRALHPRMHAVIGAACMVATKLGLAHFSEVIGLTGCLPPQLPAQLDHRPFFERMYDHLPTAFREERQPADAKPGELSPELLRLRQDWQIARSQLYLWFLTLAGLADENEQRVLLAAMSLADGNAGQVGRWLAGQAPSTEEREGLLKQVKRWHPQTSITESNITALLLQAAEQVRRAWEQLGKAPLP